MDNREYYCSQKFRFIKIDLESNTMYTCDAAKPHSIDLQWLEKNPGQLFNNEININERLMMLQNQRNSSCEQNCWPAEDRGTLSPRLLRGGNIKTHTEIYTQPEILDLTINGNCNLTCSYCCKEYSSAWRRDIINNGNYKITQGDSRYQAETKDHILNKLSQSTIKQSKHYQLLLNEIRLISPGLKTLYVTGGEPLLDNQLIDILMDLPLDPLVEVNLFTGLGMSMSRFKLLLGKLETISKKYVNFRLKISAESTDKFFEFNRYGNKWNEFLAKIELLKNQNINFIFHSTISNLTLFKFVEFYKTFEKYTFTFDVANQPTMLAPHILDIDSKQMIQQSLTELPPDLAMRILQMIQATPTEMEKQNLKEFLTEFVSRRPDLDLRIFPTTFLTWLEL
ncbi:Radical SAM [uncultured Caudovirales phage]|uniref:Radical SAM n=1 Tax=uncultured Caudovirales phage TaxID=2100421 RepID=A0A6J5T0B5_9CAUD|nr:Radical SAM [uncultured Caudovirales phage]CAB4165650.1 Radical SAM [uncultured Caudovirales phage]CAB4186700.1 Radical SAM [uncultured Caudovirales phage]CAB4220949.1 Radical SAM [uncultured Caudovirales phage]